MGTELLAAIADLQVGFAFKSAEFVSPQDGVRLARCDNLGHGSLRWEGARAWRPSSAEIVEQYSLAVGDVLVGMDRPWISSGLKRAVVRQRDLPALLVQRVARLRAKPGVDQGFVRVLVESPQFTEHILAVQTGTTVPHVSGKQILEFALPRLPDLDEQKAIAAVLGALDDKIEANLGVARQAEELLAVLASMQTHLPTVALDDVVKSARSSIDPRSLNAAPVDLFSIPAFDAKRRPDRCGAADILSGKFVVTERSVLVSRLNPSIPRVWLADPTDVTALCSTEFLVLTPQPGCSLSSVWLAVCSHDYTDEAARRATGTSFSHQRIKPGDALSIEVPDCRLADAAVLEEADAWLDVVLQARREVAAAEALRDALLPELLSGRLRASDQVGVAVGRT